MPYSFDPSPAEAPPGLDLIHDLRFEASGFDAVAGIVQAAAAAGAAIEAMRADRSGAGVLMRCRVVGISEQSARALVDALERDGWSAGRAQLEHLMIARKSSVR